jgi:predicted O-linked N-acetylglucosamine transferase (SPINDLY family)
MERMARKDVAAALEVAVRAHHAGELERAAEVYRRILEVEPRLVEVLYLLGALLGQQGQHEEAVAFLQRALDVRPHYAEAYGSLGEAYLALGRLEHAVGAFERSLVLKPNHAGTLVNLGTAWQYRGDVEKAAACFGAAIQLRPEMAEAHFNAANLFRELGRWDEAIAGYRRAVALRPAYAEAWSNLGYALKATGRLEEALAAFREASRIRPGDAAIHSGIAYLMMFEPGVTMEGIYKEHAAWNQAHAAHLADRGVEFRNERSVGRRLRVGYVSADFRDHCQSFFTMPLLRGHDREQVEVICYSSVRRPDDVTARIRGYANVWRDVGTLSDERLAEVVREDGIDILVDLTMHMANGRLLMFARRPAPVQVTWLAYPGTTGLTAMDYRLTDPWLDLVGAEGVGKFDQFYSEKTMRLPETFWCYDPLTADPEVATLPALAAGHITFGCLNNFCKVNEAVVELWAEALQSVAGSRMIILCPAGVSRERVIAGFAKCGVEAGRIEFVEARPRREYLATYNRIDLSLDTVPYNGHTTTLDGLWMGVPVVTLVGETVAGRGGMSLMSNLGLGEFVARTREEFLGIAIRAARDLAGLARLRTKLRGRMERSVLMDGTRFARNVERAYREMWRAWVEPRSF